MTAEQAVERYRTYGVDGVMIGRGALRNPFLFEQSAALLKGVDAPEVTAERFLAMLLKQRKYLSESFDERGALLHARKFLAWYCSGYPGASQFRKLVFNVPTEAELWDSAEEFFSISLRKRDFGYLSEPFLMGGHG